MYDVCNICLVPEQNIRKEEYGHWSSYLRRILVIMSLTEYKIDKSMCRLCYQNVGVIPLFDSNPIIQLCDKFMYCVKVSVKETDGLPAHICTCCEEELSSTYNFILKCEETDKKLRTYDFPNTLTEHEYKEEIKEELDEQLVNNDADFHESKNDIEDDLESEDLNDINKSSSRQNYASRKNRTKEINIDTRPEKIKKELDKQLVKNDANLHQSTINIKDDLGSPNVPKKKSKLDFGILTKRVYGTSNRTKKKSQKASTCKCTICYRNCNNPSTLLIHMRTHTNERPHACSSCDKKYKDSGSLKRHIERNHLKDVRKKNFICEQCGKGFFTKNDCKIHIRIHTGETPYICKLCPARFTQIGTLLKHQIRHTGERSHLCTTCNKKFFTKEQLKKHYSVHTSEKKHPCPVCNYLFKSKNNLKKHLQRHSAQDTPQYICNYCGSAYTAKSNLKTHILAQHSHKSGFCDNCQKYVSNLETHMWRHTGERPLKCELCSSSYYNLKGLTTHYNFRHKYANKYECNHGDCTLKFSSQPMLDFHITKYHKSVKPFACNKCSRTFYRKSDLVRHKKGTHKEIPE